MNKTQVAQLLTVASGFDRRQVDELTVTAWHQVPEIAGANYDTAVKVVIAHQTSPQAGEYFTVRHLVAGLRKSARSTVEAIEADVRSAKARGLVEQDWPRRQPLTADIAEKLTAARNRERDETRRYLEVEGA